MSKSVKKFIKNKAKFFCTMTYNETRNGFDMEKYPTKTPGIYFIVDTNDGVFDILKVGKSESENGLHGRLGHYQQNKIDMRIVKEQMQTTLKGKILSVYTLEIPMEEVLFEGYAVQSTFSRSLERMLSIQAKNEGHSMLLTGNH
jgi:hypothetical protein